MTRGEKKIKQAITALRAAIKAGDAVEEAIDCVTTANGACWRTTSAQMEICLDHLTSKSARKLADEAWTPRT